MSLWSEQRQELKLQQVMVKPREILGNKGLIYSHVGNLNSGIEFLDFSEFLFRDSPGGSAVELRDSFLETNLWNYINLNKLKV